MRLHRSLICIDIAKPVTISSSEAYSTADYEQVSARNAFEDAREVPLQAYPSSTYAEATLTPSATNVSATQESQAFPAATDESASFIRRRSSTATPEIQALRTILSAGSPAPTPTSEAEQQDFRRSSISSAVREEPLRSSPGSQTPTTPPTDTRRTSTDATPRSYEPQPPPAYQEAQVFGDGQRASSRSSSISESARQTAPSKLSEGQASSSSTTTPEIQALRTILSAGSPAPTPISEAEQQDFRRSSISSSVREEPLRSSPGSQTPTASLSDSRRVSIDSTLRPSEPYSSPSITEQTAPSTSHEGQASSFYYDPRNTSTTHHSVSRVTCTNADQWSRTARCSPIVRQIVCQALALTVRVCTNTDQWSRQQDVRRSLSHLQHEKIH